MTKIGQTKKRPQIFSIPIGSLVLQDKMSDKNTIFKYEKAIIRKKLQIKAKYNLGNFQIKDLKAKKQKI